MMNFIMNFTRRINLERVAKRNNNGAVIFDDLPLPTLIRTNLCKI